MCDEEDKKDRFDLERDILGMYSFRRDIDNLADAIENDDLDYYDAMAALRGIAVNLEIYSDKMFKTYCEAFDLGTEDPDESDFADDYAKDPFPNSKLDPRYPYNYNL
jgi:hypothetical protein